MADSYALGPSRSQGLVDVLDRVLDKGLVVAGMFACALPFAEFLDMLPPLRPRYYSISSSPLVSPDTCSITVGVLRRPARSGDGTFTGVGSGYLADLPEKATVFTFLRSPSIAFRPPDNPHAPMIMIGAGTGIAPFRGFLQERAALRDRGVPVGPSLLFFGCRNREIDLLYVDPPYNTRQYAGYYHVPELIARGWFDEDVSLRGKTGLIDDDDQRSAWCSRRQAPDALRELLEATGARHVLVSYNSEGVISNRELRGILSESAVDGRARRFAKRYKRYRADSDREGRRYKGDVVQELLYYARLR